MRYINTIDGLKDSLGSGSLHVSKVVSNRSINFWLVVTLVILFITAISWPKQAVRATKEGSKPVSLTAPNNTAQNNSSSNASETINSTTTSGSGSSKGAPKTSVVVNGHNVNVPDNGTVQQTINTSNTHTTLSVTSNSTSDTDTGSTQNMNVQVNSVSSSDINSSQEDSTN